MSKWHQFEVRQFDLNHREADYDLRGLYKDAHRWLKANASGKWKIARLRSNGGLMSIRSFLKFEPVASDGIKISVKSDRDAALFKMFFADRFVRAPAAGIIFSIIRRNAGSLLASQIVGVQPMTGPVGHVFALKTRYVDQSNPNNRMFGGSPSQRRAWRKRMRKLGVVFTAHQFRPKGQPIKSFAKAKMDLNALLENTRKELLRGR